MSRSESYWKEALSGNIVIFVMVSWMYNNAKDVKTEIDNTLRVSAPLRLCVKLENNNAKMQRRDGANKKAPCGCKSVVAWAKHRMIPIR